MDTKKMEVTCIICPMGCRVSMEYKNFAENVHFMENGNSEEQKEDYLEQISGNRCPRGAQFIRDELTAPMRSVTTTVRTAFPDVPVLPVRTNGEIPKQSISALMNELSETLVSKQIGIGDVVVGNILGTGCDIIATSDVLKYV